MENIRALFLQFLRTFSVLKDAELLTRAMCPDGYLSTGMAALRGKSLATRVQDIVTFFSARIQFLLDVLTQFQCNSRNSLMGTQVQLALRTYGQDMRASQNAPSREVYCLKGPCQE
jgi:hypothetical protein